MVAGLGRSFRARGWSLALEWQIRHSSVGELRSPNGDRNVQTKSTTTSTRRGTTSRRNGSTQIFDDFDDSRRLVRLFVHGYVLLFTSLFRVVLPWFRLVPVIAEGYQCQGTLRFRFGHLRGYLWFSAA